MSVYTDLGRLTLGGTIGFIATYYFLYKVAVDPAEAADYFFHPPSDPFFGAGVVALSIAEGVILAAGAAAGALLIGPEEESQQQETQNCSLR